MKIIQRQRNQQHKQKQRPQRAKIFNVKLTISRKRCVSRRQIVCKVAESFRYYSCLWDGVGEIKASLNWLRGSHCIACERQHTKRNLQKKVKKKRTRVTVKQNYAKLTNKTWINPNFSIEKRFSTVIQCE